MPGLENGEIQLNHVAGGTSGQQAPNPVFSWVKRNRIATGIIGVLIVMFFMVAFAYGALDRKTAKLQYAANQAISSGQLTQPSEGATVEQQLKSLKDNDIVIVGAVNAIDQDLKKARADLDRLIELIDEAVKRVRANPTPNP